LKLVIDPAHGGKLSGVQGLSGRMEDDYVLEMAYKIRESMQLLGHECVLIREEDRQFASTIDEDNKLRSLEVDKHAPYDIALMLHCNVGSTAAGELSGTRVFYDHTRQHATGFTDLAKNLEFGIAEALGVRNWNNLQNGMYHLACKRLLGESLLIETCYIRNPLDEEALNLSMDYVVTAIVSNLLAYYAKEDRPIVAVDGKVIGYGQIVGDRTYVPLRAIGDALGVFTDWDDRLRLASLDVRI